MNRFWVLLSLVAAILFVEVAPAHAQSEGASLRRRFSGEAFGGLEWTNGDTGMVLGVSGTWFFGTDQTDRAVQFGFRPEVSFTRGKGFGGDYHEYIFTANLEMDIVSLNAIGEVSDGVVPYIYLGGGLSYLTSDIGGPLTNNTLDNSGGIFQVGVGAKVYPLLNLYVAPQYTFVQTLGATEASHHRITGNVGVSF